MIARLAALLLATAAVPLAAQDSAAPVPRPMLSEPALSPDGTTIAFVSGGDIWEVPAAGGIARLLVTDPATEGRPRYSPDGRRLAFTSNRGGSTNIHVLNLDSGAITRLTYAEANEELDGWSGDGRWLYFASSAGDVARQSDIFRVPVTGGTPQQVSGERYLSEFQAAPAPDGGRIALVARGIANAQWWRNGHSHIDENEIWLKQADGTGAYRLLLGDGAKHAWPIWSADGGAITYMSDRDGTENLWRVALTPGAVPQQLTRFTDGRLLFPSGAQAGGDIVFERDMGVWRFDAATGAAAPVPIRLRGAPAAEPRRHQRFARFDRMALSPDGRKVALIAHGEVFAAAAKDGGPAQRITTSLAAEREVAWSPDSRRLLYVTEAGQDRRLALSDIAGGRETMLTRAGVAVAPSWSGDGRAIAYVRNRRELRVYRPAQGKVAASDTLLFTGALAVDEDGPRPVWSPDGAWIAFPVRDARSFVNVHVVPAAGGAARQVGFLANGWLGQIAWSPDGRYILFDTAQRTEPSRIVRIDLIPRVPRYREDLFRGLFDDTPDATPDAAKAAAPKPVADAAPVRPMVRIEWDGLRDRASVLPLGMSAEAPVIAADGKTLVFRAQERERDNLYRYSLDEQAATPPSAQQITANDRPKGDFDLSGDGKLLAWLEDGRVMTTPLAEPKPQMVDIGAEMDVDFAAERGIVFDQAWGTLDRGFFDPGFTGHDWRAIGARFRPYALAAATPDELRRVINLMFGELNASHMGINRPMRGDGALPVDRVGNLGVTFDPAAAEAGRGLVVATLVPNGPAAVSAAIAPGDRIVAIDGVAIGPHDNLDALLDHRVGDRVSVTIDRGGTRRQTVVRPVSASVAAGLRYRAWVAERRAMTERLSAGRFGYVHIPDMSAESLTQLYLDLDATNQARQGVVIDLRHNDGGFVNGYALDVFARRNFLTMQTRGQPPVPSRQALGQRALGLPTVLLTDESSLSDAEDFTEGYRTLGLGKVVGQPTAGWIIYTSPTALIDGSIMRVPHTRIRDTAGRDLEMHPRPVDVDVTRPLGESGDAQLMKGIEVLGSGQPMPPIARGSR
ncbi:MULTISPECIES: S41 family peptidase [unclassified Sphingomonas]|uniref:S41 family peptidase n=1 Tax=unclassified Sphingomonas TaxID=196159 RepID=UPI000AECC032|nr:MULTISPECIES: S41 family peptidase [unclassified Sphingomonas]